MVYISGMSDDRAAEYRRKAQECVGHAHRAVAPEDKANWLQMAEGWQRMAENVARRDIVLPPDGDRLAAEASTRKPN